MNPKERLEDIIRRVLHYHQYDATCKDCLTKEQAKSSLLDLFKEMVPEIADNSEFDEGDEGYNTCRQEILAKIEEMR